MSSHDGVWWTRHLTRALTYAANLVRDGLVFRFWVDDKGHYYFKTEHKGCSERLKKSPRW